MIFFHNYDRFCNNWVFVAVLKLFVYFKAIFLIPSATRKFEKFFTFAKPSVLLEPSALSSFLLFLVLKYIKDDLQQILKTVIEFKFIALKKLSNRSQKRCYKTKTSYVYKSKSYIDCYNIIQQYENYFAISKAKSFNRISFATIFFKKKFLFW